MLLRAERARLDADQANADKSRFLAEAGHDLRTPLTTILGYGEIIEREMMGPIGRTVYRDAAENIVERRPAVDGAGSPTSSSCRGSTARSPGRPTRPPLVRPPCCATPMAGRCPASPPSG